MADDFHLWNQRVARIIRKVPTPVWKLVGAGVTPIFWLVLGIAMYVNSPSLAIIAFFMASLFGCFAALNQLHEHKLSVAWRVTALTVIGLLVVVLFRILGETVTEKELQANNEAITQVARNAIAFHQAGLTDVAVEPPCAQCGNTTNPLASTFTVRNVGNNDIVRLSVMCQVLVAGSQRMGELVKPFDASYEVRLRAHAAASDDSCLTLSDQLGRFGRLDCVEFNMAVRYATMRMADEEQRAFRWVALRRDGFQWHEQPAGSHVQCIKR